MKRVILLLGLIIMGCSSEYDPAEVEGALQSTNLGSAQQKTNNNFLPINLGTNFIFGMNGHPYTQSPYNTPQFSKQLQINNLKEHHCNFYRVDINPETTNPDLATFRNSGIEILPVLIFNPDFTKPVSEQFALGQALGTEMYSKTGPLPYYEVGNELEIRCMYPNTNGDNVSDYDPDKMSKLAEVTKGIISVLKANNPSCKIIISNGGWLHYKYFQILQTKNVNYDIIGTHWYSGMGLMTSLVPPFSSRNVLAELETFNKPIWITEVNNAADENAITLSDEIPRAQWLVNFINDLHNHPLVQGMFIYEMYDQSAIIGWSLEEATLGIIFENGNRKLRSDALKYKAEESKYGYEDYIWRVFDKALGVTTPSVSSIQYYSTQLKQTQNKGIALSSLLNSTTYYQKYIKELYLKIHNREADASGLSYWTNQMAQGMTREDVHVEFCKSQEFWSLPVGPYQYNNNKSFLEKLFLRVLGRPANTDGLNYWISQFNNGATKSYVINSFLHSTEFYDKFVRSNFSVILNSNPPEQSADIDYWVSEMHAGVDQKAVITEFLKSEQFFMKSIVDGYKRRNLTTGYVFTDEYNLLSLSLSH